jgi:hypothetical protein
MRVSNELEKNKLEEVMVYFKILSKIFSGRAEEYHENPQLQ